MSSFVYSDGKMLTQEAILAFQEVIFSWWKVHRRSLPWRETRDPYKILLSEVMLQQTQVSRVLEKYQLFTRKYPTVADLAAADFSAILIDWKGLGYNRRARNLWLTTQAVVEKYQGIFPKTEEELLALPGIGKYTARAILVFALEQQIAFVDTNVRKILTHYFFDDISQEEKRIEKVASAVLPPGKAWEWHQALMDYGSLELPNHLPKVLIKKTKNSIPFRQSRRFYRGRIIDALREKSYTDRELSQVILDLYGSSSWDIPELINTLICESLIERNKQGILSIPKRRS